MSGQKKLTLFAAGYLLLYLVSGCGYTTRSNLSGSFRTIYIPQFVNQIDITRDSDAANSYKIYRPNLEAEITRSVIDKFLSDGNLRPVKSEDADLILKGELVEFRRDPLRYTDNDEVEEYRLNLVVNLSLRDAKGNKPVWEEKNFIGDTSYFVTGNLAKSEAQAVNDALSDLSRRIVERTVEQW
jgi:outer membrane lipopolysaccharide assembly protein LptE/RlpB